MKDRWDFYFLLYFSATSATTCKKIHELKELVVSLGRVCPWASFRSEQFFVLNLLLIGCV